MGTQRNGRLILISLAIASLISAQGRSWAKNGRLYRRLAIEITDNLKADLAAQSGLELAQRRLQLDPNWSGHDFVIGETHVQTWALKGQNHHQLFAESILGAAHSKVKLTLPMGENRGIAKGEG